MSQWLTLHKHEVVAKCGSFEVRFHDGRDSGFFYFQTGFMRSSTLYISGLKDAKSGEELFYFEIPLAEALK